MPGLSLVLPLFYDSWGIYKELLQGLFLKLSSPDEKKIFKWSACKSSPIFLFFCIDSLFKIAFFSTRKTRFFFINIKKNDKK